MSPDDVTVRRAAEADPPAEVRHRFLAWKEAYLGSFPEAERAELSAEVELLETTWRQRIEKADACRKPQPTTVHAAPAATAQQQRADDGFLPGATEAPATVRGGSAAGAGGQAGPGRVAGYEILGVLGRGAMGVVYKARQVGLNRTVALKMIRAGAAAGPQDLARFRREAEAVAQLRHPHIVGVYEVGEADGQPYFSLEYVEGPSLDRTVRGRPLPPGQAAALLAPLARAMSHAHAHGIIHRDLKPANVLMTAEGTPKVGDFGLARRLEEDAGQTRSGMVLGTPSYMAPEQAEGRVHDVGPLADVYSLGAVLYECLTGRPPFTGATLLDTLKQVSTQEPVAPRQLQPGVPRDLETVCLKCLHKDPRRRYASAAVLAEELDRFLAGRPIHARPVGPVGRLTRWCRRNPLPAGLLGLAAALLVAWAVTASLLSWFAYAQKREADHQASRAREKEALAQAEAARALQQEMKAQQEAARAARNAKKAKDTADLTVRQIIGLGESLAKKLYRRPASAQEAPEADRLRHDVLASLRQSLAVLGREVEKAGVTTFGRMATLQEMGDLLMRLGQWREALAAYRQGYELAREKARAEPANDLAQANLAVMLERLGHVDRDQTGDARAACAWYRQARELHLGVFTHPGSGFFSATDAHRLTSFADMHLGRALMGLGRPAEAHRLFAEALRHRLAWQKALPQRVPPRSYVMETHLWLAVADSRRPGGTRAEAHFRRAAEIGAGLVRAYPGSAAFKADVADVLGARGDHLLRAGKVGKARECYEESLRNLRAALARDPGNLEHQTLLALTHERLAAAARRGGKPGGAAADEQEALRLRAELLRTEPDNSFRRAAWLLALARCGKQADALSGADAMRRRVGNSPELLLQLARCYAACAAAGPGRAGPLTAKALEAVRAAARLGYRDAVAVRGDPALAGLLGQPGFPPELR
jgi:tetratricopeptide (TPR) repeat protein